MAFSCKRRDFCPSCGARRMAESAALLVDEVFPAQPVRQWVLSFPCPLRFLFASRPAIMSHVLGIVYRCIATHLIKKAGFSCTTARTGAVTLIQRFGSALNLNVHFHVLFLDGVYVDSAKGSSTRFRWVKAPTSAELTHLTHTIARRVGRFLERQGLLERDAENSYLAGDTMEAGPLDALLGHSITYRIAVGPQAGRKVFTLQTLPDCNEPFDDSVGKVAGFSLHAGVAARADERKKLERLCRYIALHGCRVLRRLGTIASVLGRRCRKSGCRSRPMAMCVTSSRRRTAMAPRMSSSSRWTSSPGLSRWCPSPGST